MENKINVAELLKDCPLGMELDCTMFDNVTLVRVDLSKGQFPIEIALSGLRSKHLTKEGCFHDPTLLSEAKCVIFPKGKKSWEGFQRPFKDGDVVFYDDTIAIFKEWEKAALFRTHVSICLYTELLDVNVPLFGKGIKKAMRYATEEEKQKLFDAIKLKGFRWNAETKILEELTEFDVFLDNVCKWFEPRLTAFIGKEDAKEVITEFRKAMEE